MIYILTLLLIILSALVNLKDKKGEKIFIKQSIIITALVMAFRSTSVGADTEHYSELYLFASRVGWHNLAGQGVEIGYLAFMKMCSFICEDYYFFQIVYSVIFALLFYSVFKDLESPFLVMILYLCSGFYLYSFNIQRQMLSTALLFYSWKCAIDKRWIKLVVCILIAEAFHTTSVIGLIPFLLYYTHDRWKILYIMPLIALGTIVYYPLLIDYAAQNVDNYGNYYANNRTIMQAGGAIIIWIIESLFSVFIVYNAKKFTIEERIAAIASLFMIATSVVGLQFNYFERLGMYFAPYIIIVYLAMKRYLNRFNIGKLYTLALSLCYIFYFILSVNSEQYHYSSYLW